MTQKANYYCFLTPDDSASSASIKKIRSQYLKTSDQIRFDHDSVYGDRLSPEELKKSLMALPAVAKQRVIEIRKADKLKKQHKEIILEFLDGAFSHNVLIIHSDKLTEKDVLVKGLVKHGAKLSVKTQTFGKTVFDMADDIIRGNADDAVLILHELLDNGEDPLRLMGGLVWKWGKARSRLGATRFKKGLLHMQKADRYLKRSQLRSDYTMELLVAQLSVV